MWRNKKPDTPQGADPEPKNLQANQPLKPAPASWEGTTKMNKDVVRPPGATPDRATARLGSSLHVKGKSRATRTCTLTEQLKGWSISMSGS